MLPFFLKRILRAIPALIALSLIAFFVLRLLPGDPVQQLLGERGGSQKAVEEMRAALGLDKPLWQQYLLFISAAAKGDLGRSIATGESVAKEFFAYFPATVELSLCALLWAMLLGIPLGLFAALNKNTFWDSALISMSLLGFSMSVFWWGLILILVFSVSLGWTPVSGRIDILYEIKFATGFYLIDAWLSEGGARAFGSALKHLALPSLTLGTIPLAFIFRITRSSFLEILDRDFIRTAKAKGLGFYQVFFRHAFRNTLIPVVTVIGFLAGALLTGAVLTETVFSWPGIGRWFVQGILARDYPVITGGILMMAFIIAAINLCVDGLYMKIDPRFQSVMSSGSEALKP